MHSVGDNGSSSNVPAFLVKLWKLVDDKATDDMIKWNSSGLSFTIRDQARFARELLPLYYKHNNMASFVRQLNMYGFHKVVSVDSGALKAEREDMEFAHTYFLRGHEYLLEHIKRKIPTSKQEEGKVKPEMMSKVLCDIRSMKGKQDTLDTRLVSMKRENEALWQEVSSLRQKHLKQQQIVNKLIQFLITVVQPNGRAGLGAKRRHPLMLDEVAHSAKEEEINARNEAKALKNGNLATGVQKDRVYPDAPAISSQTPGGPVIHDVTDLIDDPGNDGVVEVPIDEDEDDISYLTNGPIVTEAQETNDSSTSHLSSVSSRQQPRSSPTIPHERLNNVYSSLDNPPSPEVLVAVNPREVLGVVSLAGNRSRPANARKSRDPPASVTSKEDLDTHLDAIQMDLENLREFLSMQNESVDASTLLGVCDIMDPDAGSPPSLWQARDSFACYKNLSEISRFQQDLPSSSRKAFIPAEQTLSSNDLPNSSSSGSLNPGIGNEIMSYNPSFFEFTGDDGHFLGVPDAGNAASSIDLDSASDDFLNLPDSPDIDEPVAKKWKR